MFICSLPSTITSPYLVHLLFSPSTLGAAIRPSREGMLRCMPACRDSLFLFKAWLIKQWGNRPFPSEEQAWFGWALQHSSVLLSTHLLILLLLFLFITFIPPSPADYSDVAFIMLLCHFCFIFRHTTDKNRGRTKVCIMKRRRTEQEPSSLYMHELRLKSSTWAQHHVSSETVWDCPLRKGKSNSHLFQNINMACVTNDCWEQRHK